MLFFVAYFTIATINRYLFDFLFQELRLAKNLGVAKGEEVKVIELYIPIKTSGLYTRHKMVIRIVNSLKTCYSKKTSVISLIAISLYILYVCSSLVNLCQHIDRNTELLLTEEILDQLRLLLYPIIY